MTTRGLGRMLMAVTVAVVMMACSTGGGASPSATSAPTGSGPAATPGQTSTATPEPLAERRDFAISSSTFGLSQVNLLEAVDVLNGQGWEIEYPELAQSELAMEGLTSGKFQFSTGASNTVLQVVERGENVKYIADRIANEWTVYGTSDITECAGLDGKRLAIHSSGAVSTAMVKNWVAKECPGTEPQYIEISGSPNRMAALIAGQIDASPLELSDALTLERQEPGRFRLLTNMAEDLSDLHPTTLYVDADFATEYPGSVRALLRAVIEQNRKINADSSGGYLQQLYEKHLGSEIDISVAERYVSLNLFDSNGGLDEAGVEFTLEFFTDAGVVQPGLTVDQVSDLSHLEAVLDEIGRQ